MSLASARVLRAISGNFDIKVIHGRTKEHSDAAQILYESRDFLVLLSVFCVLSVLGVLGVLCVKNSAPLHMKTNSTVWITDSTK